MAYNSNGSYLKSVSVPRYSTDALPRGPPLRDDTTSSPSNEYIVHGNGGPLYRNSHSSPGNYASDSHQATPGRQQFQGIFAPPLSAANGPGIRGEDSARPNKSSPPLDYQLLLLSLAEEYFAAAHGSELLDAMYRGEMEMQAYYRLIATGLGCFEALLKVGNFISPLVGEIATGGLTARRTRSCNHIWKPWYV